jgi:IS30 family transposase
MLYRELRHGKRLRKKGNYKDRRGMIKDRIPIEVRPVVVITRERIRDIEVNLIMGKGDKSALLVLTKRATLLTALEKINSKDAKLVSQAIIKMLSSVNTSRIKTLT